MREGFEIVCSGLSEQWGPGGGDMTPQILADHLTLSQPGGGAYYSTYPSPPRIFRPSYTCFVGWRGPI